jgi:hypothetical protein
MKTFYNQLSGSDKKFIKAKLMEISEIRKQQLSLFNQLQQPISDNMDMLRAFLKNEVSFQQYLKHSDKLNKYFLKFLSDKTDDGGK